MNLQPLGDRLIVEVLEEEETTSAASSCPIRRRRSPSAAASLPSARAAGRGRGVHPDGSGRGDEIVFSNYGGTEIKVGAEDYLILRESDVLAKVVGDREPAGAAA